MASRRMFLAALCLPAVLLLGGGLPAALHADDAVLLRHKFAKGDQAHYRTSTELKQSQKFLEMNFQNTMNLEGVTTRSVEEVSSEGKATLKQKTHSLKASADMGPLGKFKFDSKSTERDTGSQIGGALTPLYERLSGAEYEVVVTPMGQVTEVKGYAEQLADILKDNPIATQFGAGGSNEAAKLTEQDAYVTFSDKPVKPGDQWEIPFEFALPKLGKLRGKTTYTFEAFDKVGETKTVRLGQTTELTMDLDLDNPDAKVTGSISTTSSSGTIQFDPEAGRVVSMKRDYSMSGQLTVNAGGMVFNIDQTQDQTISLEVLAKLPE